MKSRALPPTTPHIASTSREVPPPLKVAAQPVSRVKDEPLGYRINDASKAAGVGRTSIYKLIAEGKLEVVKVAGRTIIVGASLRALFHAGR